MKRDETGPARFLSWARFGASTREFAVLTLLLVAAWIVSVAAVGREHRARGAEMAKGLEFDALAVS
jgi:hypothetical protein